jgi:hypothetical protein
MISPQIVKFKKTEDRPSMRLLPNWEKPALQKAETEWKTALKSASEKGKAGRQ